MLSLNPQFVNYISTSKANTLLFLLKKNVKILCIAKNKRICNIAILIFNELLTNYIINSYKPGVLCMGHRQTE